MAFGTNAAKKDNPTDVIDKINIGGPQSIQERMTTVNPYRPNVNKQESKQIRFAPATSQLKTGLNFYQQMVMPAVSNPDKGTDRTSNRGSKAKFPTKR